jgi:hypothetical protein
MDECGGHPYIGAVVTRTRDRWQLVDAGDPEGVGQQACVLPDRVVGLIESAGSLRDVRALGDLELRVAVATACVLGEMAAAAELHDGPPWTLDLALDQALVASRAGATHAELGRAIALLLSSQAILYSPGHAGVVRVAAECWGFAPYVRELRWDVVRERLSVIRAPFMPALALLRELALGMRSEEGWTRLTLDEAAERTFFKRSTMARAASDLEEAGCVERSHRPGQRGLYRILPLGVATPVATTVTDSGPSASDAIIVREAPAPPAAVAPPATVREPMTTPIIEISGVAFPIPPGVTLVPELDADGRLWYRFGAGNTRIGPLM